jgi:electron transfer flavoprotein beta subunit
MGADRAVLITDESLAGADLLVTARALAGALERESADIVLFGQQSADGDGACLFAAVAELLRRPVISQVSELSVGPGAVTGKRQTEYGYERVRAPLPVVVAVSDAINEPRYPSLKGIMSAKTKPQETLSSGDVGGSGESRTVVLGTAAPPARGESRRIEDDGGNAAEAIVEFLMEKRVL